jgi:small subunit ribosomal protein S6
MFLLDSNRYGRDPEGVSGQIPAMIREAGGEVLVSRLWEERRLAYSIRGRRKGTYWLTYFRLGGRKLADLKRQSQLSDDILRVLFIKIDPRIVDTLVEHAQAGTVKSASDRTAERHAGRATKEAAPATKEAAPATKEATPATKEATPATKEATPAKGEDADKPALEHRPQ